MLVLSRVAGEEIVIAKEIIVKIVSIRGGRVKLGITAPEDVPVHRREVFDAIQAELRTGRRATMARR